MRSASSRARRLAPLEEQFFDRLVIGDDCWTLLGEPDAAGYMRIGPNHALMGHRVSYELLVGPVFGDLDVDHVCRNQRCVRPDHLEPVTHRENIRRHYAHQTHCKHGHEYVEANIYFNPRGARECRVCRDAHVRAWKEAHAAV